MLYYCKGSENQVFSDESIRDAVFNILENLGDKKRVLVIPPDITRFYSHAGIITTFIHEFFGDKLKAILPAIGTHFPMTDEEISRMYGDIPRSLFVQHNWRTDVITLGEVPSDFVNEVSENRVSYSWPAQVNKLLVEGNFDLILSVGQVVPHEVVGMANYNKNIFVGTGGAEGINKSHFLGAAYGMERMMGRADTPVRKVLNYASEHYAAHLPLVYIHTVVDRGEDNKMKVRGVFAGDDMECFTKAADLSLKVNFQMLDVPLTKVVVYLEPEEFKSTWLGNKAIYRTRMAIADGGELIILAPGLREFGEDREIDRLIRKYGYFTTPEILKLTRENDDLGGNLSAAAHLIHGSSENRFTITYCPGKLSKEEIEKANFNYHDLDDMLKKYNPDLLKDGYNNLPGGDEIYYISNPAIGLWSTSEKFNQY
ncbi:MAG: lactate racemase domain-containing protein [Bacteroidota bacterium]